MGDVKDRQTDKESIYTTEVNMVSIATMAVDMDMDMENRQKAISAKEPKKREEKERKRKKKGSSLTVINGNMCAISVW
jgi:hypothetical protein